MKLRDASGPYLEAVCEICGLVALYSRNHCGIGQKCWCPGCKAYTMVGKWVDLKGTISDQATIQPNLVLVKS